MMPRLNVAERMPPPENATPNGLRWCASSTGCGLAASSGSPRRWRTCLCSVSRTVSKLTVISVSPFARDDKVSDSSGLNGQFDRIAHETRKDRAEVARTSWLLLSVLLALLPHGLDAQTTRDVARSCRPSPEIAWRSLAPLTDGDVLDRWCDSVGPPFVKVGASPPPALASLVVATWNVHVGNGDVESFLASLVSLPRVRAPFGVVLLLQEAVRTGAEVPAHYPDRMRPPRAIRGERTERDVGALAVRCGQAAL